jgi:hypothetical protein
MRTLPKSILSNFWLKIFSVALATVIWMAIHFGLKNELSISQLNINNIRVSVAVVAPDGDKRVFKITPSEVIVSAVGDKMALRKGIKAYVDLAGFHIRQSESEEVHVEAPPEINVLAISPATVSVEQISP